MKYQKKGNLFGNRSNQPSRFRTKDWVQTNDDTRGTYNANSQIKSKIKILKSIFCDYSNAKNYDTELMQVPEAQQMLNQTKEIKKQYSKIVHYSLTAQAK